MRSVKEYVILLLDEPYKKNMEMLDSYDSRLFKLQEERPTELLGFKDHLKKVERLKTALSSLNFNLSLDVILATINDDISNSQDAWLSSKQEKFAYIDSQIEALKDKIEQENIEHNKALQTENAQVNVTFESLEAKRKILEGFSDKIFDICNQYGISLTDINIDERNFTAEELDSLYDDYTAYLNKESKGTNIISKYRSLVKDSLYVHVFMLILFVIVCLTPILDFVSIAFFIALALNQYSNVNRAKYYSVLMAIVFKLKPENMGYVQLDESLLLPEVITPEMMDTDERFAMFEQMYEDAENECEASNPSNAQISLMNDWSDAQPDLNAKLKTYEQTYNSKIRAIIHDVDEEIKFLEKEYERLKSEYRFIGERFKKDYNFGTNYTFGIHDDCMEETVDIGFRNVIVRPNLDKTLMDKFLQTVFANTISNVRPGLLKIIVYDPNDFGRSVMPFYSSDLKDYFEIHNDGLDNIINDQVQYVQENFKFMQGKSISEYNSEVYKTGKTPIEYRLLLILSQPKTIEEDREA